MEHSAAFGGGQGDCWEIASRFFSIFQPGSNCRGHGPTVCGRRPPTTLGFQRLADFRGFRPLRKSDVPIAFKSRRKRQKSTKVGHSGCYHLPRSRLCGYLRQSTRCACSPDLTPQSMTLRRANAGVRFGVSRIRTAPSVFNPWSRVCGVSLVARSRGTMRALLTVAD